MCIKSRETIKKTEGAGKSGLSRQPFLFGLFRRSIACYLAKDDDLLKSEIEVDGIIFRRATKRLAVSRCWSQHNCIRDPGAQGKSIC